ncbi:Peptidase-S9 domain-containing protein [Mycena kentingensis (nom. inval.)]|nr:Peptidase-S9 domain-containing protein [Mycena kentingensis (nom. inval.)]
MTSAPYGTWNSPISASNITKASVRLAEVVVDSGSGKVYHLEGRPSEGGRNVLVASETGQDAVGKEWNVRSGVHEYGGAPAVVHNGVIYFSHIGDGRVYMQTVGGEALPVTPDNKEYRYADIVVHPIHPHILVAIWEDHTNATTPASVSNKLCVIDTQARVVSELVSGACFYASPRFSPDGSKIVWKNWMLPYMPWETADLFIADFDAQTLAVSNSSRIAGGSPSISISYPSWANASTLLFTSDASGYINPWKYDVETRTASPLLPEPLSEDFGSCFRPSTAFQDGRAVLYLIDVASGNRTFVDNPYVAIQSVRSVRDDAVAFIGSPVDAAPEMVLCTLTPTSNATFSTIASKPSSGPDFPKSLFSLPKPITLNAPPSQRPIHVVYYPPTNPDYTGTSVSGELPPCVVHAHGGPTSFTSQALEMSTQYYTSRGWAWLNVNFGGSSAYGRAYIERLAKTWGVVDIEDCIQAAKILSSAEYALIDPKRIIIRGGSSGGLTALGAVSTSSDLTAFAAATSMYGISDLRGLVADTHKFESGYMVGLLGGDLKEIPQVYAERSPVDHADKIVAPLLILQGDIDRVVPKEQSEVIYESIKRRGGVVEYKLYEGEGHGFRKEDTLVDALERELAFYERVLQIRA